MHATELQSCSYNVRIIIGKSLFRCLHSIIKQEAQGACGARLVLTNLLGFVCFFFSTKLYIYLALAIIEQIKNTLFMQT